MNHQSLNRPVEAARIDITLTDLPRGGVFETETTRVDAENGNALAAWEEMGRPEYITEKQRLFLEAVSMPERACARVETENGAVTLSLCLPPMGVCLLSLYL